MCRRELTDMVVVMKAFQMLKECLGITRPSTQVCLIKRARIKKAGDGKMSLPSQKWKWWERDEKEYVRGIKEAGSWLWRTINHSNQQLVYTLFRPAELIVRTVTVVRLNTTNKVQYTNQDISVNHCWLVNAGEKLDMQII